MPEDSVARRRWLSLLFLTAAAGMLFWGRIVLMPYIQGFAYSSYYAACCALALAAVGIAGWDILAILSEMKRQRRVLLKRTMVTMKRGGSDGPVGGE